MPIRIRCLCRASRADGYAFLSFLGEVHEVDFTGAQPVVRAAVVAGRAAREQATGGPAASRSARSTARSSRLYVPMHVGGEGTHKDGGTEIWVFDIATISAWRAGRCSATGSRAWSAVQVSQDDAPLLFAANDSLRRRGFRRPHRPPAARREAARPDSLADAESIRDGTRDASLDHLFERSSRSLAQRTSRRSLLGDARPAC